MSKGPSALPLLLGLGGLAVLAYWGSSSSASPPSPEPPSPEPSPTPPKPKEPTPGVPASGLPADVKPASVVNCMSAEVVKEPYALFNTQRALNNLKIGPKLKVDAQCGTDTKKAIAAYRAARGLIPGEFVNARMFAMLKAETPCSFKPIHWVVRPELWGVLSLVGTPGAFVIIDPKSTKLGSYEAAAIVEKDASTGTEDGGAVCPYGIVTKVLKSGVNVSVGDFAAKRVPNISSTGAVTWTEEPWALDE